MGGRGSGGHREGGGAGSVESKVLAAYEDLKTGPGDWVSLASIRDKLGNVPREQADAALTSLAMKPGVHVIQWDNFKALSARDRSAALRLGGQMNHAIRVESKRPRRA